MIPFGFILTLKYLFFSDLRFDHSALTLPEKLINQQVSVMENNNIILHSVTPTELKEMLRSLVREEFELMNNEVQRVIGEDDLVSTGTACRLLGVCSKVMRHLIQEGHFTVFHHMKERRFVRAEILEFRNKNRVNRLKRS